MNARRKQHGLGAMGWLFLVLVFGTAITLGMKLLPLYLDFNTMSGVLDGMAAEDGLGDKRSNDLYALITKQFKVNNIRDFKIKENIEIKRTKNGTEIWMVYEVRQPFFSNVDLITSFDKRVELRN